MEIEKTPPKMSKKLWNLVRIVVYMMRKSISKSKLMLDDLDSLTKRAKIASKAIGNYLVIHHHQYRRHSALSCRSDDVLSSFISPREYEFSCSNSPAYHSTRKNRHHRYDHRFHRQAEEIHVLQRAFDVSGLRDHDADQYPGLGNSPLVVSVRQLRVTDSPFANDQAEENHQVDRDAEKFINRFYKDLRNQRRIAAFHESPPSYHIM
ncbi:uncharacterized protein [Henckelia pumila]|uniref:uncharacterized protein n=1 Tax=Henckelia pumila TaxID=405737 RepID=UPI003C6E0E83